MTSPQEQQFGKYRVEAEIGRGGFGVVYRAIDSTLDRPVALKILDPMLSRDAEWARRFQQEARVMARLDHPHIVPIYETGNEAGRVYIAMKLIEGGSLATRIGQGGPLPWNAAVRIIREIAGALDYAHEHGIIHRDLKPGNILLGAGGAVLTDFGLARLVGESTLNPTMSGGMVGTWTYIAPEIWNGAKPDERADIYALGCILYEMVTGQVLFGGENVAAIIGSHHKPLLLPTRWPSPLPDGLTAVLHQALHRDAASRYATAGAMAAELEQLAEASHITVSPSPRQERARVSERVVTNNKDLEPTGPVPARTPGPTAGVMGVGLALVGFIVLVLAVGLLNGLQNADNNQSEENPIVANLEAMSTLSNTPTLPLTFTPKPVASLIPSNTPTLPPTFTPTRPPSRTPTPSNTPTPTHTPVITRKRASDGMIMVYVPGGTFMMGSDPTVDEDAFDDEQPQHPVTLDSFWLDSTEVTNAMYSICVDDGLCQAPQSDSGPIQGGDFPVVGVSWYDADAYCAWTEGQLPTEAQWEYAAGGLDGRLYPWGNEPPTCDRALFGECNHFTSLTIGSFPSGNSWVGAADMGGNVWELVADWYGPYEDSWVENPTGPKFGNNKVLRGGFFGGFAVYLRVGYREEVVTDYRSDSVGFRCASTSFE